MICYLQLCQKCSSILPADLFFCNETRNGFMKNLKIIHKLILAGGCRCEKSQSFGLKSLIAIVVNFEALQSHFEAVCHYLSCEHRTRQLHHITALTDLQLKLDRIQMLKPEIKSMWQNDQSILSIFVVAFVDHQHQQIRMECSAMKSQFSIAIELKIINYSRLS